MIVLRVGRRLGVVLTIDEYAVRLPKLGVHEVEIVAPTTAGPEGTSRHGDTFRACPPMKAGA